MTYLTLFEKYWSIITQIKNFDDINLKSPHGHTDHRAPEKEN